MTRAAPRESRAAAASRVSILVTAICWGLVVLEGYDLISFGSVLPELLKDEAAGYTPGNVGLVAAAAFVGATVGALSSGWLSDRYGRRPVAIGSLVVFSIFTMLCGFSEGPSQLGVLRFLAGIGIGAIVPSTSALTLEYASARHRTLSYTLMLSGVPVGGVLAALSGMILIPSHGWRWVFWIALAPAVVVLPFIVAKLPESLTFLERSGRTERAAELRARLGLDTDGEAHAAAHAGPRDEQRIFGAGYRLASIMFAVATFFGLLTWFGLGTWIPGIMRKMDYDLGSALTFLLVLNVGAIAGSIVIAVATDRYGPRPVLVGTYSILTVALLVLLVKMPQPPLLAAMALAGVGGHGGQILINRYVGRSYPAASRARALGWSLGAGRLGTVVGPIAIGWIVGHLEARIGFLFFALCSAACAMVLLAIPATPASVREEE
ncbi:aromatic acid/H+ symport family MFS transporter [Tsukamurella sp. 8F]|uniref:MFS transporter n=1 Tax=unclassified Tsukamurella TaxID=2633480 RepID=UPI0023BA2C0F|nr:MULTISPECIES: aromatic acid/H+ symport family MFS transporter [unclassified Tsukamurella]MDF0528509.1 aromatic acid/H+ symport family MFS transporter [Tsukamurella sp. 8J]MDF0586335.1 aromatic acid/H+ symport family MFS transporter [Tsukamurella sp. 8F]